ncbi:hypothetical protein FM114_05980 [Luteococcus japonicus LSP_Lj1]|uniref:Uncharacterized protein n=1 Tax=Luteococcus japonicus LSP_Lj1 TaxID=1255658 RepID=A0A1R4J8A7_9ACTN|nr:hypothetical protein FM114_05980 [Luteococcus japonicus LSP_Lj1]
MGSNLLAARASPRSRREDQRRMPHDPAVDHPDLINQDP